MKLNYIKTLFAAVLVIFATTANAATYSGTCGDNVNWSLDTETGLLKITGTGNMRNYTGTSMPWYSYRTSIKSVEISEGVTSIGFYAFSECSGLTSITIPNSVTSIGYYAFSECSGLTSITIPNSVTSIGYQAFSGCSGLTSIDVASDNANYTSIDGVLFNKDKTSIISFPARKKGEYVIPNSVTTIGDHAFDGCPGLTSITIPNSVTGIGSNAFDGCPGLTEVYITDLAAWCNINFIQYDSNPFYYAKKLYLNNELVTNLVIPEGVSTIKEWAFLECSGLTSITIPNSVTTIGRNAFDGCSGLTSITIPNSVTTIGRNAFDGCSGLTSITIPNSVTTIEEGVFKGCTKLSDLRFEDGEKTLSLNLSDYNGLFADCPLETLYLGRNLSYKTSSSYDYSPFYNKTSLTSVTIGDSVTSIQNDTFEDCTGLTGVYITDLKAWCNIDFGNYAANPLYFAKNMYLNNELVTDLVIPEGVTTIKNSAFRNCSGLTSVTIPNSVTTIGTNAFSSCSGLTGVYITDLAAWCNINFIQYDSNPLYFAKNMYLNNELVTDLVIPEGVTTIKNSAFRNCSGLTSITIPNSVTTIEEGVFNGCSKLSELRFEDGEKTLSLGYHSYEKGLFYDCPLETLYLGRNLSYKTSSSYGYSPFYNKTSLTSVTIGDSVTSIQNNTFKDCTGLTGVYITDLKAWCNIDFGYSRANPLYYAEKLYLNNELVTNLNIPKEVTELKDYSFYNCPLTSVTIPNSVTSIGDSTFYYSTSKIFTLCTTPPALGTNTFYPYSASVHLFGEANDANVYKSTSGWSKFKNYVTHSLPLDFTAINEEKTITYRLTSKEEANNQRVSVIKGEEPYRGNINIPDTVNYMDIDFTVNAIGDAAFSESNIVEIGLPQTLEKIGDEAFYGCSRLRNMTYPESLKSIGVSAFEDCVKMTEVVLCENVEKIEAYAFAGCTGLTNVYSLNPVPPVCDVDAFYGIGVEVQPMTLNKAVTNVSLYVPEGSVSAYQAAPEWCNFYNIVASDFVGIEDVEIDTNSDKPNAYISGGMLMLAGIDMPTNVAVYNLSGRIVANVMVTHNNCSIDLSTLPKGVYIVAFKGGTYKVIL